jgi:hypothetical protein
VSFDQSFNPADFIPADLSSRVCLVCAMPLGKRMDFEKEIFDTLEIEEHARAHGLEPSEVLQHLKVCVAERDSTIPLGRLIGDLTSQLSMYINELDRYRLYINSERNPESLQTYTGMFRELRQTIEALRRFSTPQQLGERVKTEVVKPLVLSMLRAKIEVLKDLREDVNLMVDTKQQAKVDQLMSEALKKWGGVATSQNNQALTKIAEILGLEPKSFVE